MKPVVFLSPAEQEMIESAVYYESQAHGLGTDFLAEVERAVDSVVESPDMWPIIEGRVRKRLLRRFPFGVLYYNDPHEIVFVAVAHLRRKPGYWKERLK